jgi:hypothetical protein
MGVNGSNLMLRIDQLIPTERVGARQVDTEEDVRAIVRMALLTRYITRMDNGLFTPMSDVSVKVFPHDGGYLLGRGHSFVLATRIHSYLANKELERTNQVQKQVLVPVEHYVPSDFLRENDNVKERKVTQEELVQRLQRAYEKATKRATDLQSQGISSIDRILNADSVFAFYMDVNKTMQQVKQQVAHYDMTEYRERRNTGGTQLIDKQTFAQIVSGAYANLDRFNFHGVEQIHGDVLRDIRNRIITYLSDGNGQV